MYPCALVNSSLTVPRQKPHTLSVARNVIAADGVAGLWRGTVPSLFR